MRPPLAEFVVVAVALAMCLYLLTSFVFGVGSGSVLVSLLVFVALSAVTGRVLHLWYPHDHLGLCNVITLARLAMAVSLIAPLISGTGPSWAVFVVAVVALSLDGIDGWLARRQGYVSDFGARFDMEVDSVLALVLALSAAISSGLGLVFVLLGLPRYAFAIAAWALPWMQQDLPERFSRKAVCVIQLAALIALQIPILPLGLAVVIAVVATLALIWSFAVDVTWLWRRRV